MEYRRRQALISARLARQIVQTWRLLVNPARVDASWPALRDVLGSGVQHARAESAQLAREFYMEARQDAGVPDGLFVPDPAPELAPERLVTSLDVTGPVEFKRAISTGKSPEQAADAAAVRMSGSSTYLALEGGRDVMEQSIRHDERATGWSRVTDADPCAWCAMLASRGPVYKAAVTAGDPRQGGNRYHDHCVPAGTLVDGPAAEVGYRRQYEGEMILVGTAAGHGLRITPNHPVLTDRGWVPAGLLCVGDHVLSSFNAQGSLLQVPDEEQVPSRVEDVWGALGVLGLVRVPGSSEDFHGDGTESEVDVVRADGLLGRKAEAEAGEVAPELELPLTGVGERLLTPLRSEFAFLQRDVAATDGFVGGLNLLGALLRCEAGHGERGCLTHGPSAYLGLLENAGHNAAGHPVASGDRLLGFPRGVRVGDFLDRELLAGGVGFDPALVQFAPEDTAGHAGLGLDLFTGLARQVEGYGLIELGGVGLGAGPRFDPPALDFLVEGRDAYAGLGRDLRERLAGRVELDRIVDLRRTEFSGHVYNFQTSEGWYRADGVIVSNCGCQAWPAFTLDEPFIGIADKLYEDWRRETRGTGGNDAVNAFRRWWESEGRAGYTAPDRPQ